MPSCLSLNTRYFRKGRTKFCYTCACWYMYAYTTNYFHLFEEGSLSGRPRTGQDNAISAAWKQNRQAWQPHYTQLYSYLFYRRNCKIKRRNSAFASNTLYNYSINLTLFACLFFSLSKRCSISMFCKSLSRCKEILKST